MKRLFSSVRQPVVPVVAIAIGFCTVAVSGCTETAASSQVTNRPESAQLALAQHLTASGARMYGAYWCPHCASQKDLFGDAFSTIDYVECDPEGENAQPDLCEEKGIQGYPTWEIDGTLYPGARPLEALAELSNYNGPRDFER